MAHVWPLYLIILLNQFINTTFLLSGEDSKSCSVNKMENMLNLVVTNINYNRQLHKLEL